MRDIDKYTKEALEEANGAIFHVIKYQHEEKSYGITKITYDLMPGKHLHWLSIPSIGVFTPVCLIMNGMQAALSEPRTLYFDTSSGELLGNSQNEAALCANKKGIGFFNQGKFSEAREWFNKAYYTCSGDDPNEETYKNSKDSASVREREQRAQQEKERQEQLRKQQEKLQQQQERGHRELYDQGKKLWNEAWEAENDNDEANDRSGEAKIKFQEAKDKFTKACELAPGPDGSEYEKWSQICSLKIDGNELFNQGLALQEQGNQLKERAEYEKACAKYQEVKVKFQQGFDSSSDKRFQACIKLVQENISETSQAIQNATTKQLTTDLIALKLSHEISANPVTGFDGIKQETPTFPVQLVYTTNAQMNL